MHLRIPNKITYNSYNQYTISFGNCFLIVAFKQSLKLHKLYKEQWKRAHQRCVQKFGNIRAVQRLAWACM